MENNKQISKFHDQTIMILIISLLTAIGSELKVMPYEDAPFRFGLGSIIFFLSILIRPVPLIRIGLITGITVVVFRVSLDQMIFGGNISKHFLQHLPAALFYITFAFCLHIINIEKYKLKPFLLGLLATSFEVISNLIEQLFTTLIVTKLPITLEEVFWLITIAFARSFFVVGLYSSITISEQKKQMQQLLNIGSNLYVETLYLQKTMEHIEKITASSFDLYKQIKEYDAYLSIKALSIAQEIHEVKKDSQRIYAGLSKIVKVQRTDTLSISKLLQYVVDANEKYSEFSRKKISFKVTFNKDFHTHEHIALLAVINNLVANAVEAINVEGRIHISIITLKEITTIKVEDNGVGIPSHFIPIIFDPGYTSKFNQKGEPSTGIGLSHVEVIVKRLEGEVKVESNKVTKFIITIPKYKLQ